LPEDLGAIPSVEQLPTNTGSDKAISQAKEWLDICKVSHPECYQASKRQAESPQNQFVPTRLLDVGKGAGDVVKVVEARKLGIRDEYMTLSHRWAPDKLELLVSNEEELMQGIEWSQLRKTWRHTIEITRQLGIRYIWIDSLCIIQKGKGSGGDFDKEGHTMHKIYRNAYCNITAANSGDSGLYRLLLPGFEFAIYSKRV
jgi:hypothetical protein